MQSVRAVLRSDGDGLVMTTLLLTLRTYNVKLSNYKGTLPIMKFFRTTVENFEVILFASH